MQVTSDADREAAKKLIAAKQEITQKQLREQTEADVLAYMAVKQAEGEKQAAELQYEAKLRLAEGDAQSNIRRSDGEKALKMVEVNVERERVNVEQARVEVERQSLSNKQEFEGAALKFEIEKLRIQADKEVRIAAAAALGQMLQNAKMQIFGDPETMAKMSQRFMAAAAFGSGADGLLQTLPPKAQELLARLSASAISTLGVNPAATADTTATPSDGHGA